MDSKELESAVEGILFASGEPVQADRICFALSLERAEVERILRRLQDYYAYERRGIRLLQMEDRWQLCSAPDHAETIRKAFEIRKPAKLSQPALEALTIIAYYQPTTRAYVDKLRGVDSAYTVGLLLERGLIETCGNLQAPGRPLLYRTTEKFLRSFHISSLDELPPLNEDDLPPRQLKIEDLPETEKPSDSTGDAVSPDPETVDASEPETVNTPHPETMDASEPETLDAPEPETMDAPEPETVDTPEPETVDASEPETMDASEPETVDTPEPETVDASEPETVDALEPETVDTPHPETVDTAEPETMDVPEPETMDASEPETMDAAEPETVDTPEPETVDASEPETVDAPEPETVDTPEPETVDTPEPETADASEPETVDASEPETVDAPEAALSVRELLAVSRPRLLSKRVSRPRAARKPYRLAGTFRTRRKRPGRRRRKARKIARPRVSDPVKPPSVSVPVRRKLSGKTVRRCFRCLFFGCWLSWPFCSF